MNGTEKRKEKIVRTVAGMPVPQQRIVYAYAHELLYITRRRLGVDDLPKGRPAPGQIVWVLSELLDKADRRQMICVQKFAGDVARNFRVG